MRRTALIALAGCLAALGLAAPAAWGGRAWGPPERVFAGDGTPVVAPVTAEYTARGELIMVWSGPPAMIGPPTNVAIRRPGSRTFGRPVELDSRASIVTRFATNGRGDTLIGLLPNWGGAKVAFREAGGSWVTHALPEPSRNRVAAVAIGPRGDAAVAYHHWNERLELIYKPPGGTFGAPVSVKADPVGQEPHLALGPGGTASLVWKERNAYGVVEVRAVQRRASGSLTAVQTLSRPGVFGHTPSVTADAEGRIVAAWVEGSGEFASGPVMTSRAIPGCCFGAPRQAGATGYREGLEIQALEPGVAAISFFGLDRNLAADRITPHGPTVVGALTASGATTTPQRLGPGVADYQRPLAVNHRGDAAAVMDYDLIAVSRRAPGQGFGPRVGVMCDDNGWVSQDAAMSPTGDLAVFAGLPSPNAPVYLLEDHAAAQDGDCAPAPAARRRRAGRLALQARMPRGGKLVRGRWLGLRATCGTACRMRVTGTVKIAGRRKRIPFTPVTIRRPRAGTSSLRAVLTRARASTVRRALARRKVVRAHVHVRATGGGAGRTLTFRVRVRRR